MYRKMIAFGVVGLLLVTSIVRSGEPKDDKGAQARALVEEQKVTRAVDEALLRARQLTRQDIANNPDGALSHLKDLNTRLSNHPDLGGEVRDALRTRLMTALRETSAKVTAMKLAQKTRYDSVKENIEKAGRIYRDYPKKALKLLRTTTLQVWDDPDLSDAYRSSLLSQLVAARTELTKHDR